MQPLRKTFIVYSTKTMNFKEPNVNHHWKYLIDKISKDGLPLLTQFEVCTKSNGPSFSEWIYSPSTKCDSHKSEPKTWFITYCMDQENEVSTMFIISLG